MTLRVVTLPPLLSGERVVEFVRDARALGADVIEVRNDLYSSFPVECEGGLPILASERGAPLSAEWLARATWIDREAPCSRSDKTVILSHHASTPMSADAATEFWSTQPHASAHAIKHVEPLGSLADAPRLFATQAKLAALVGADKVTVLASGPCALPFRALLAEKNAFDYLALNSDWSAAPGQRLLADARRSAGGAGPRLGILGSKIGLSRSPRIHPQPFDRIDLPEDAPIGSLLDALHPYYRGFAVTSPFKRAAALAAGASIPSINTLARRSTGWRATNTDVAGAKATLQELGSNEVTILGNGGVRWAIEEAARAMNVETHVLTRAEAARAPLRKAVIWTWPPHITAPTDLAFAERKVAVIAYGPAGKMIAEQIQMRGGVPLRLGSRWFIAQARAQQSFWEAS